MLSSLALLLAVAAAAEPISAERAATIERDQKKAQKAVAEKYGNKKPSELTQDERREMIREQLAADREVLEKHGISAKDWARHEISQSREERAEQKAAAEKLEADEKAAAEKAEKEKSAKKEIEIQRGFSDDDPVVLDEKEGAAPRVDQGISGEAARDADEARGVDQVADTKDKDKGDEGAAPKKSGKGGKKR